MYKTIKFNDMILADIDNFQEVPPCNIAKITLPYSIENSLLAIKNGFVFTDRTILTTIQVSKAEFNFDKLIRVEIEEGMRSSQIVELLKKNDVIKSSLAAKIYIKLNNKTNLQAGKYDF
ncbi:endolytic transglycosylase MltG, partial [bacterium]|nr:endolytic transglycosylase MltG [bacterium]